MSRWLRACAVTLLLSCLPDLQVGQERTARDEQVGQAEQAGARVVVADGKAVVRRLEPGLLQLWGNAPELQLELDPGEHRRTWIVELANALEDVELLGHPAVRLPSESPTRQRWQLEINERVQLQVQAYDRADLQPWRFVFFADVQEAIDRVQDLFAPMNRERARFALIGGDLTEQGTLEELQRFEQELGQLQIPAFATVGNHELFEADGAEFQAWFGRASSHFEFRGVSFSLLDSASSSLDPKLNEALDGWLEAGRDRLHVVTMHVPPLDPDGHRAGGFVSRMEAQKLLAKLARGKVDVTLYGHIHSYYAFSNAGIPAYIAGGGGSIPERMDGIGRHYLVVEVDPRAQTVATTLRRID